jgi:hypothetical protein
MERKHGRRHGYDPGRGGAAGARGVPQSILLRADEVIE